MSRKNITELQINPLVQAGAYFDGVHDDQPALELCIDDGLTDFVIPGPMKLGTTATYPRGVNLTFTDAGYLAPATGVTLTFHGTFLDTFKNVFRGAGAVVGFRRARPQNFGAVGNGTANDTAAVQKALNCIMASSQSDGDEQTLLGGGYYYGINQTLHVYLGPDVSFRQDGAGTVLYQSRLIALSTFTGGGPLIHYHGGVGSEGIVDFRISDWAYVASDTGYGTCAAYYKFGDDDPTTQLIGQDYNEVVNLYCGGIPGGGQYVHCRLITHKNLSVWQNALPGSPVGLYAAAKGGFTNDVVFDESCIVVMNGFNTGCKGQLIESITGPYNPANGNNSVTAFKFYGAIFTATWCVDVAIAAGGWVSELFFTGAQFDGKCGTVARITCDSSASSSNCENIWFVNNYISECTEPVFDLISTSGGNIRTIFWNNVEQKTSAKEVIKVTGTGVESLDVNGVIPIDNNNHNGSFNGAVFDFGQAVGVNVRGVQLQRRLGSYPDILFKFSAGADWVSLVGNLSRGYCSTAIISGDSGITNKYIPVGGNI